MDTDFLFFVSPKPRAKYQPMTGESWVNINHECTHRRQGLKLASDSLKLNLQLFRRNIGQ